MQEKSRLLLLWSLRSTRFAFCLLVRVSKEAISCFLHQAMAASGMRRFFFVFCLIVKWRHFCPKSANEMKSIVGMSSVSVDHPKEDGSIAGHSFEANCTGGFLIDGPRNKGIKSLRLVVWVPVTRSEVKKLIWNSMINVMRPVCFNVAQSKTLKVS